MDLTIIFRLAIALALGLIIGMERGWNTRQSPPGMRLAGVRSFGFVGLLGGLSATLADLFDSSILAVALLGFTLMVGVSFALTAKENTKFGVTTELALLVTFSLGALAGKGLTWEALSISVVTAVLLGFKEELHKYLNYLERQELIATLQLLLIAVVALPLLPDRAMGPWNALNPRAIWLLVSLIAGISYVGYFAMKILGTRVGLLATAALGALVSSTAVTVSFGRIARREQQNFALLGAGISLAAGTMAVRILVEVTLINPALLPRLVPPIGCLAIVPLLAALAIATRLSEKVEPTEKMELKNPIELGSALIYGVIIAVLFVGIRAMESWFGDAGIYALSALSGITDVDAVSLSLAEATKGSLPPAVGATGILIAAMVNTAVKAILATAIGGWQLAKWCASILLISLGLSVLAMFFIHVNIS
jgi:uncharacterized membrane protein (DUF4010 family)